MDISLGGENTTGENTSGSADTPQTQSGTWPDNDLTQAIPKPDVNAIGKCEIDDSSGTLRFIRVFIEWTQEQAEEYGNSLEEYGWRSIINEVTGNGYIYRGSKDNFWITIDNAGDRWTIYIERD